MNTEESTITESQLAEKLEFEELESATAEIKQRSA